MKEHARQIQQPPPKNKNVVLLLHLKVHIFVHGMYRREINAPYELQANVNDCCSGECATINRNKVRARMTSGSGNVLLRIV